MKVGAPRRFIHDIGHWLRNGEKSLLAIVYSFDLGRTNKEYPTLAYYHLCMVSKMDFALSTYGLHLHPPPPVSGATRSL
jgi:hypothetical protein